MELGQSELGSSFKENVPEDKTDHINKSGKRNEQMYEYAKLEKFGVSYPAIEEKHDGNKVISKDRVHLL